jgi:5-formyltetrahydrofolate cyclo-ligase
MQIVKKIFVDKNDIPVDKIITEIGNIYWKQKVLKI